MMRKIMYSVTLVALTTALVSSAASASESRSAALVDSSMVLDLTDIVDFPGLLGIYGNTGFLNVGSPAVASANGGLLLGSDLVVGAWVMRNRDFDDIAAANANINISLPTTYNIADIFFGMSNGFGIRASLATGLDTVDTINNGNSDSDGAHALSIEVQPGFTMQHDRYRGDFGLGVTLNHYKTADDGDAIAKAIPIPSFLLRHRSTLGRHTDAMNGIFDITVTRRSYAAKHVSNDSKTTLGRWYASLVAGPKFNLPANVTITTGIKAQLEGAGGSDVAANGDKSKTDKIITTGIPGAILTGEVFIRDLLTLRAGLDYSHYWVTTRSYDANNDLDEKIRTVGQQVRWSAGLGLTLDRFQIDGTLCQDLLLDGPDFIGGRSPGLLTMLSATYSWQ